MEQLIAIVGPTAAGKTKVSVDLANRLHTEIISGDSMLVYQGFNIGTAKPTLQEREGVPHHLIDCCQPQQEFTATDFQELAGRHISDINQRSRIPIVVGGTGLYVKALLEGYRFSPAPVNEPLRAQLEALSRQHGAAFVHRLLAEADPATANRLHPNDIRRVIRALEVFHSEGTAIARPIPAPQLRYQAVVIGLTMERAKLYERINRRVELMFQAGLVDEVQQLLHSGISADCQAMQGIGYKEIIAYLQGTASLSATMEKIQQATRHFAKRQWTWYRKMPYILWFDVDTFSDYTTIMETIYKLIAEKLFIK